MSAQLPEFTVIIPAFNGEAVLPRAVRSVLSQTVEREIEIVVVDDGSSDATAEAARAFTDTRVRVLRQKNQGPSVARNVGAGAANGKYLTFLDCDDVALPGWLAAFWSVLEGNLALVAQCGVLVPVPNSSSKTQALLPEEACQGDLFPSGPHFPGSFALSTALFHDIGGYAPELRLGENSELLFRLMHASELGRLAMRAIPEALVLHMTSRAYSQRERRITAEFMLRNHSERLARDQQIIGIYHAMIATDELRIGRRGAALAGYTRAFRASPSWKGFLRLGWPWVPSPVRRAFRPTLDEQSVADIS